MTIYYIVRNNTNTNITLTAPPTTLHRVTKLL